MQTYLFGSVVTVTPVAFSSAIYWSIYKEPSVPLFTSATLYPSRRLIEQHKPQLKHGLHTYPRRLEHTLEAYKQSNITICRLYSLYNSEYNSLYNSEM